MTTNKIHMKKSLLLSLALFFLVFSNTFSQSCGTAFTDPGGTTSDYSNNTDYTVTICPSIPGDKVTVTFTSFNTESTWDGLYVYNGNSTSAPQIVSSNPAGNGPLTVAGAFWGTTIPEPFTSTSADGCLTFRFRSDSSGTRSGWVANVTCAPPASCSKPTALTTSAITATSATLGWTQAANPNNIFATAWEVLVVPIGSPAPLESTIGVSATVNPYFITGLNPNTCYTYYVRAVCSETDNSAWSVGSNFCTTSLPPVCGGQFVDNGGWNGAYGNNENTTTTICPNNAGETVTVTFSSFSTQTALDALYVFDGNSANAPQIASSNPAGSVPGGLAGGYWGGTIPGPFTSSSSDGCLTFSFRSDVSTANQGWLANITCAPQPSCLKPTNLSLTSISTTTASLTWTADNTVSSWEVIAMPVGTYPTSNAIGQIVTTNSGVITELNMGTAYSFYVRANCTAGDHSFWSLRSNGTTLLANDECANAIEIAVSPGHSCAQTTPGSINGATASSQTLSAPCIGTANDDVWFKFTATNSSLGLSLQNIVGTTTALNFSVYSGTCDSLTPFYCSTANAVSGMLNNLTVGTTYYLRVYSNLSTPQTTTFNICISVPSTCASSQSICGLNNYVNTTGVSSLGTIGCLSSTPNPTYFTVRIAVTGPVNLLLTQTSNLTTPNLDVDYAAWGPFASPTEACAAISGGQAPGIGVPVTQTTGCSYSAAPSETLNIADAVAGQYYVLLITNYSNDPGWISVSQSNANAVGAGSIDCSGVRLNAFLDSNSNGTQDSGEPNFPLGQFHYEINNSGNPHAIISPTGSYILYDEVAANVYNLSYSINGDYNTLYTTPAGFTNVNPSLGAMTVYNFPVTATQVYTDLGVTIVPQSSPRAGASYTVKITYSNNGTQTIAAGNLTFNNNAGTTITNISQSGTVPITNGFTYAFTDLLPFETRSIIVTISVPTIPTVSLGQLLTNTASITPPTGDTVANNDTSSATQAIVASYDPNDKVEGHGEKIIYSSFTADNYLEYTIRFENNGTASALDVVVKDLLDGQLDENTLVMLASSHNYYLDRLGKNLTWTFNNIQLPVSVPNTDIGKGFVKFKIKPKAGFAIGDVIPNTAEIYFDSNPAIVTNTFNTIFVTTLGNEFFTENSIILYPNPANTLVQVALQNSTEIIDSITIYDVLGKKVNQIPHIASNQSIIDVSQLSKGIYLVEITTESSLKQIKKLIIQ